MFKKVVLSLIVAVMLVVPISGTALAAEGDHPELFKTRGKVIDVNIAAGKFSIETPDGTEIRFFVDDGTRYGGQISSLEDLKVGMGAGVAYKEHSEGKLIAVGLIGGSAPELIKANGEVIAVDASLGKFEIVSADGNRMRFFVDEKTRYQGQLSSLEEMQVGWQAGVAAKEGEGGALTAVLVIAGIRPETVRAEGIIVGVDVAAGKFRLEKGDGTILAFYVDEKTTYKGQIEGIRDLEEGMRAGVGGYEDQDGILIARVVAAGTPQNERPELVRAQGTIKTVSPGAGKFQLQKPDGSALTVYVDAQTQYRGQVNSFYDLEKGMRVGFAGYINEDGQIIARVVVAGQPRADRPDVERPDRERPAPEADSLLEEHTKSPNS